MIYGSAIIVYEIPWHLIFVSNNAHSQQFDGQFRMSIIQAKTMKFDPEILINCEMINYINEIY